MKWKAAIPLAGIPVIALLGYGLTRDPAFVPSPLEGRPAPSFALETLNRDTVRIEDYAGQVVLLNFWASWCVPCQYEHPLLVDVSQRFKSEGVRVVGIVYQDTRANAERWMRERGGDWVNGIDPGSHVAIEYGVRGVPETFFIGRDGRVAYRSFGPMSAETLGQWLPKLVSPAE